MAGFLVIAMFVMFGGLAVVMRSGFVMLGCGLVVAATFVALSHSCCSPFRSSNRRRSDCDRNLTGV
jgi:hypothetical protein